jgi:hypothetical protein
VATFTLTSASAMRRSRPLLLAALVSVAACAGRAHPAGLRPAHVERLYFGRNMGDTATVSDSAWAGFVRDVLTPNFPDGATVWDAAGQWRDPTGQTVREKSFVVELVHFVTPDVEARVLRVVDSYKRRFAQQSVLRIVAEAWASF